MNTHRLLTILLLIPASSLLGDELIFEGLPEGRTWFREDRQGQIYLAVLGNDGVIVRVNEGDARLWKQGEIEGLELTPDGNLWLVRNRRIWRFSDDGNADPVDRTLSFRHDGHPGQLFASRWGDVWWAGGRAMRRRDGMFVPSVPGPDPAWVLSPVADDPFGNVWAIASHRGGQHKKLAVLARKRPHQWQLIESQYTEFGHWIDVCSDDVGSVWMASGQGVLRIDPQSDNPDGTEIASPNGTLITSIAPVANRQIVVGFSDGTIQELTVRSDSEPQWKSVLSVGKGPVRTMHHDRSGGLWVVRGDNLYRNDLLKAEWHRHWDEQPRLPAGNHDIIFARIEDKLYTAGGKTYFGWPASEWTHLDHVWSYDIKDSTWTIEAPMLEPGKSYSGVAALGGEVWLLGGYFIEGNQTVGTSTVEIFDPRSRRVRPGPSLDEPRGQVVALTVGDRLFAIGGGTKTMFSIAVDEAEWRIEPAPPGPVAQASGCVLDGRIYVASGSGSKCPGLFAYDPQQRIWSEVIHPADTAPSAPLCAAHNGEVWVMGGVGSGGGRTAAYVYSPDSGQWRRGPDLPLPVAWGAAAEVDGRLLIAGGAYHETRAKDYHNSDRAFLLRP